MADQKKKRGFVGRLFRPWENITPQRDDGLRVSDELRALRVGLSEKEQLCPVDGKQLELITIIDEREGTSQRALACDCGWQMPVDDVIQNVQKELIGVKNAERQFMTYGLLMVIVFGGISLLNGSLITFLGGAILGLALIIRSIFFRYRGWQMQNERMFEEKAPIMDWLRNEWNS